MGPDWVASAAPGAGGIGPLSKTEGRSEASTSNTPFGFMWKLPGPFAVLARFSSCPFST